MMYTQEKPSLAELAHHGVKGQKWGVRTEEELAPRDAAKKNDLKKERFRDRHRKALIGAGAVATVLAAYGTYKFVDSGHARQAISVGKEFATKEKYTWATNKNLSKKMSPDDLFTQVVTPINPRYGDIGTKMNCRRCTFAYEMRRRGLDVTATKSTLATGQTSIGVLNATTPNSNKRTGLLSVLVNVIRENDNSGPISTALRHPLGENVIVKNMGLDGRETAHRIFKFLAEEPDGARGELGVSWKIGGKHSMAYEKVQGKPIVFDTQSGQLYSTADRFYAHMADSIKEAGATRLDNKSLNGPYLRRWVRNAY